MILPDIDIDDDGDICLEWHLARGKELSMYINSQELGYAGIDNGKSFRGRLFLPERIRDFLIRNCTQEAQGDDLLNR